MEMGFIDIVEELFSINLNQSSDCFSIGTSKGFYIYNINPLMILDFQGLIK